jgi:hypothetical protein
LNGNRSCILFNSLNGIRRGVDWTNLLECLEVLANNVPLLECYIQVACLYLKEMIRIASHDRYAVLWMQILINIKMEKTY